MTLYVPLIITVKLGPQRQHRVHLAHFHSVWETLTLLIVTSVPQGTTAQAQVSLVSAIQDFIVQPVRVLPLQPITHVLKDIIAQVALDFLLNVLLACTKMQLAK